MFIFGLLSLSILFKLINASDLNQSDQQQPQGSQSSSFSNDSSSLLPPAGKSIVTRKDGFSPAIKGSYDHDRIKEIKEIFEKHKTAIPTVISEIIGEYEYNGSINEFYKKIMDYLKVSERERGTSLDFYKSNFASQLTKLLESKSYQELSTIHKHFWITLYRLLFKWMIYARILFVNNETEFESAIKSSKSLFRIIRKYDRWSLSEPVQSFVNDKNIENSFSSLFSFAMFQDLIAFELMEDTSLFQLFTLIVQDFYHYHNKNNENKRKRRKWDREEKKNKNDNNETETEMIDPCDHVRIKYFGGNFKNNPILEIMMIIYDQNDEMKNCFPIKEHLKFRKSLLFGSPISADFPKNLLPEQVENLEIHTLELLNIPIVKFFIDNNLKFRLSLHSQIAFVLTRLDEAGLLMAKPLNEIIMIFSSSESSNENLWKWDRDGFIKGLNDAKNDITRENYEKYQQLISLY